MICRQIIFGDNELLIVRAGSNNQRGRTRIINNGRNIAYTPPVNLQEPITDRFNYTIISGDLRSTAAVSVRVNVSPDAPPGVPDDSINRIPSDLPIARAVENLCDLLTFRNDPRTPGGLNAAQKDLLECACAIVNEPDAGKQISAIQQLSGGQHQFSDTVLRFAKANSSIVLRRMAELRRIITKTISPDLSFHQTPTDPMSVIQGWQEGSGSVRSFDDRSSFNRSAVDRIESVNRRVLSPDRYINRSFISHGVDDDELLPSFDDWLFDTMSINTSSVYFSATSGDDAAQLGSGLFDNRLGFFTSITSGSGDSKDAEFEFDFDAYEIMTGVDYTIPGAERSWVFGGAFSLGKVETDAEGGSGGTDSDSLGLTLYSTVFGAGGWFAEATLNYASSDIDVERVIEFTASGKSVFQNIER